MFLSARNEHRGPSGRAWLGFVAVVALLLASFPYFDGLMNANERPRLLQGMALVEGGSWSIEDVASSSGFAAGPDVARGPDSTGGHLVPNKPPGSSVVAALAYVVHSWTGGERPSMRGYVWWARLLGGIAPTLLILIVAWRRYAHLGSTSVLTALGLYALATPVASYARLLFGHQLAAALLFMGVVTVLDATGDEPNPTRAGWGGAVAGAAVTVDYTAAFAGVPLALVLVGRAWSGRGRSRGWASIAAAGAGALLPIAGLAAYHEHAFGSPWTTPYHHVTDAGFAAIHARGLLGLTWPDGGSIFEHVLSPWGGLALWCPLLVVAIVALVQHVRSKTANTEAKLALAIVSTVLVVNLGLSQAGGWRVGPRYLMVALPFAIVGLARAVQEARKRPRVFAVLVGLAMWSVLVNALAANLFPHLIPVGNPVRDQLLPLWLTGREPYGLARVLGLEGTGPSIVVVASLVGIGWLLLAVRPPGSAGLRAAGAGVVICAALAISAYRIPPDPAAAQNLEAIESVWEPPPHGRGPRPLGP